VLTAKYIGYDTHLATQAVLGNVALSREVSYVFGNESIHQSRIVCDKRGLFVAAGVKNGFYALQRFAKELPLAETPNWLYFDHAGSHGRR